MIDNDAIVSDYLRRLEAAASGLPADSRAELIEEISAHIAEARAQGSISIAGPGSDLLDVLGRLGDPDDIVRAASNGPTLALAYVSAPWHDPGSEATAPVGSSTPAFGDAPVAATEPDESGLAAGMPSWTARRTEGWAGQRTTGHAPESDAAAGEAGTATPGHGARGPAASGLRLREIAAVVLVIGWVLVLPVSPALAVAAWVLGVVLLWYSPRWRTLDKVLGTLVVPLGLGLAVFLALLPRGDFFLHPFGFGGLYPFVRFTEILAAITAGIVVAVQLLRHASDTVA
jgi:hypothetical protein